MSKNNKQYIITIVVTALTVIMGVLLFTIYRNSSQSLPGAMKFGGNSASGKLGLVMSLIDKRYVDTVNMDSLNEMLIPMILKELDPHSIYIPAKDMIRTNESLDGKFEGIGVMFNVSTDTVIVINVISGGPSAKAGVMPGDRIITVDKFNVAGVKMDQDSIVGRLRGPRGSKVTLGLHRVGVKDILPIEVTRDVIPINSVYSNYMIAPQTGYIMLAQFSRNSYKEVFEAITGLQKDGMTRLILDIRGNSGGFLDQAIHICNMFLPEGRLIVYTQDRAGNQTKEYSNGKGTFRDMEMVLLVDEYSASSSEILAGALQDNDRCLVIGRRTFGKGLVQEQIPFSDGSALRLTVSRYYTPAGRSIQKPYTEGVDKYNQELHERYKELFSQDSVKFADTVKYKTFAGRTVYGGGGIMPDIFVPADTTSYTPYLMETVRKNILYKFTLDYTDRNRVALNNVKSFKDMDAFFAARPGLVDAFVEYAAKEGVAANRKEIEQSRFLISCQLKAYIGRNTDLNENAFSYYIKDVDNALKRALDSVTDEVGVR